jgi:protein involved in temperature-dependent protein secretion
MIEAAVEAQPSESAYRITLVRMLIVQGDNAKAEEQLGQLKALNVGGSLDRDIAELQSRLYKSTL